MPQPHRHPSAAASLPPSTSRRLYPPLRAPLSRPLAPRRRPAVPPPRAAPGRLRRPCPHLPGQRPAAAPPSRTAPPARCRASLSRRTRPPPSPPVLASPASGLRRRSHAGRRRRRPGVLECPTARHVTPAPSPGRAWAGMAARRHCAARHGGAAVPRRARAGRARAVPVPCGPVGHLYGCPLRDDMAWALPFGRCSPATSHAGQHSAVLPRRAATAGRPCSPAALPRGRRGERGREGGGERERESTAGGGEHEQKGQGANEDAHRPA